MFKGTLKPYQPEAVDKMVERGKVLVAYEMGLGKTCMTIAAIEKLRDEDRVKEPTLVIALASLKYQWQSEIKKFSDSSTIVVDGSKATRSTQYLQSGNYDYVITNYESIVNDWDLLKDIRFGAIVCDEATAIKGFRSKRTKKVKELAGTIPYRFALTGTPIENGKPEELYSIMQFVEPGLLGRFDLFDKTFIVRNNFGGVQRYRNLPLLHEKIKAASVRKAQSDPDVAPYLPATIHLDPIRVKLDKKSRDIYEKISLDLTNELTEAQDLFGGGFSIEAHYGQGWAPGSPADALRGSIMSKITALRMLCDSPSLLVESSTKYKNGWQILSEEEPEPGLKELFKVNIPGSKGGSSYLSDLDDDGWFKGLGKDCPKLDAMINYVVEHLETDENSKVVIFASYVSMLQLIQSRLLLKKIDSRTYSGQMNAKEKEAAKVEFQTSKDVRVLISSDAGGYGVDLPQANLLVNYDLPWSSGAAVQRNSRIRRTSSTWKSVIIQDFLALNSIEERQHEMLHQKNSVADAVIDGTGINAKGGVDLTVGSLLNFLTNKQI
jgi:SNF2 family DNA or RNA helicase